MTSFRTFVFFVKRIAHLFFFVKRNFQAVCCARCARRNKKNAQRARLFEKKVRQKTDRSPAHLLANAQVVCAAQQRCAAQGGGGPARQKPRGTRRTAPCFRIAHRAMRPAAARAGLTQSAPQKRLPYLTAHTPPRRSKRKHTAARCCRNPAQAPSPADCAPCRRA